VFLAKLNLLFSPSHIFFSLQPHSTYSLRATYDQNDYVYYATMDELTSMNKQKLSVNYGENPNIPPALLSSHDDDDSLHKPLLSTLPFDLIPEILCRLPVELLLQLRCICKSRNSLINDCKCAKEHLSLSTTDCLHC